MRAIIILLCAAIGFVILQQPPQDQTAARAQEEVSARIAPPDTRLDDVLAMLKVQSNELQAIEECYQQESEEIKRRLVSLEQAPEALPLVDKCCDECEAKLKDLESRVAVFELTRVTRVAPVVSSPSPVIRMPPVVSASSQAYTQRWFNHDGLSRSDHAAVAHRLDTTGMSAAEISARLDADHDTYGKDHGPIMASRARSVVSTSSAGTNCPGGVCPTGPSVQTRTRSSTSSGNGWFLGKNLRR